MGTSLKELRKVAPEGELVVSGQEVKVDEVIPYKGATSKWLNLVWHAATGLEVLIEVSDEARLYNQTREMPLNVADMKPVTTPDVTSVFFQGNRYERQELGTAQTVCRTKDGEEKAEVFFSVFSRVDEEEPDTEEDEEEDDGVEELLAIELKKGQLSIYHSTSVVPLEEIQIK